MAEEEKGELDISNPVLGSLRTKGFRLADLAMPVMAVALVWMSFTLWNHEVGAQNDKAQVANTLSKSNAEIATALKESNLSIVNALKESNANTLQALKELTAEQRRSTVAVKEGNCLQDPVMKNRADARDFCKRLTREDR